MIVSGSGSEMREVLDWLKANVGQMVKETNLHLHPLESLVGDGWTMTRRIGISPRPPARGRAGQTYEVIIDDPELSMAFSLRWR